MQSKVFLNGIPLKVIFLVEWISNCVCLHTQAGCWSLAEKTIRMEICVGLLTGWQNLTEGKEGRGLRREVRDGVTVKKGREGQFSTCFNLLMLQVLSLSPSAFCYRHLLTPPAHAHKHTLFFCLMCVNVCMSPLHRLCFLQPV